MNKKELLRELYTENGLTEEDTFIMTVGGRKVPIITRSGIEKIQAKKEIDVEYVLEQSTPERVVIKARGTIFLTLPNGGTKVVRMETYAEASPDNCKNAYPVMTCEKRALGRVVLKLAGFYKHGVFAEGENLEADTIE